MGETAEVKQTAKQTVEGIKQTVGIKKKRRGNGTFGKGNTASVGHGRPFMTPAKRVERKAIREYIDEYKQGLAEALPHIQPILKAKAVEGDVPAIKEIHDRVMGKAPQAVDLTSGGMPLGTPMKVDLTKLSYEELQALASKTRPN